DISENAASGVRRASVHTSDGQTSNDRDLQIDGCQSPADGEPPLFQSLQQLRRGYRVDLYSKFFSQGPEPGTILFTPVADGTVQQLDMVSQAGPGRSIVTSGPATSAKVAQVRGTSFDVVDRGFWLNFQRFGLTTGGALNFTANTNLEDFARSLPVPASGNGPLGQTSFGTAGAVEFDLGSLKAALQQSNLTSSAVRATFRLTPISSLN